MNSRLAIAWLLVFVASAAAILTSGRAASSAASTARAEAARAREITTCAGEIAQLRIAAPRWTSRPTHQPDLAQRLASAIATAGLPASTLASLTPDADGPASGHPLKRTAVITLTGLTLPRLGSLFDIWRQHADDWTITHVELAPQTLGRRAPEIQPGADLPLHVVIRMESIEPRTESP